MAVSQSPNLHPGPNLDHLSQPQPDMEDVASELSRLKPNASVDELIEFAYRACNGSFKPLQIESEIRRLLEILQYRRPRTVVEIGTANGGTLFLLSRIARVDALVISIDLPGGELSYEDSRRSFYKLFARVGQSLHLLKCDSHSAAALIDVLHLLEGLSIDLLFIDGDHSYEGVRLDFESYGPLVDRTGLIALHDIVPLREKQEWCEVDRFWQELKGRYFHSEIVEDRSQGWGGIGLVSRAGFAESDGGDCGESARD